MKVKTFSIIAGSEACNARCQFCVSKMTPPLGVALKEPQVDWRNFHVACRLAKQSDVTTAMITGKGEPTLFPRQITTFLEELAAYQFPIIELQTNGIMLDHQPEKYAAFFDSWYLNDLTIVAVSIVSYDPDKNRQIYLPHQERYIDLPKVIGQLHKIGFSVRLTCVLLDGFIDSSTEIMKLVEFAKSNRVEQLTLTPVNKPEDTENEEVWQWTNRHHLKDEQRQAIFDFLETNGHRVLQLAHGAIVYDLNGQNVCLNNCLSVNPDSEELRNLIFFPDGHLRYYWQYPGAIIF